jgi:hypothetical protein
VKKNTSNNNKNYKIKNVLELQKNKLRNQKPTSASHKPAAFKLNQWKRQINTKVLVMIRKMQNFSIFSEIYELALYCLVIFLGQIFFFFTKFTAII